MEILLELCGMSGIIRVGTLWYGRKKTGGRVEDFAIKKPVHTGW